jgi:hypothetical protein
MTLVKKTMIMGSLLAIFVATGMSGIAYSEEQEYIDYGILYDKDIKVVKSCKELKYPSGEVYGVRESTEKMRADFGVWLQDKDDSQFFKIGYTFPEKIYKYVADGEWGMIGDRCELVKELTKITYMVQTTELDDEDNLVYRCIDRAYESTSKAVTPDNPLTSTVDGYPSTDGLVDVKCKNDVSGVEFDGNSQHLLYIAGIYTDVKTGDTTKHLLNGNMIVLPLIPVQEINPPNWD